MDWLTIVINEAQSSQKHVPAETLKHFVLSFPAACHLKDPLTRKYILVNQVYADKVGMSQTALIGLQFRDVIFHKNSKLVNKSNLKVLNTMEATEEKVCCEKVTVQTKKNIFSTYEGILLVENYITVPIFDDKMKVIRILTYAQDLTASCDLFYLFELYQQHYITQRAILYFFRYLKIDQCFVQLPTPREVMSLLAMLLDSSHKYVAKLLSVKSKTADTHIYQLKNKLKGHVSLLEVLQSVRAGNRNIIATTDETIID